MSRLVDGSETGGKAVKICIFGAGAIGGYIGARLCQAGHAVTLIARGDHLAAMQEAGLKIIEGESESVVTPICTDDPGRAGPQDYLFIATKAHSLSAAAAMIAPLLGPETPVVIPQNGIPWWYFHGLGGGLEGKRLAAVDPGGRLGDLIPAERVIGCVVTMGSAVIEPGVIRHAAGRKLDLGEPDGSASPRCRALAEILAGAGFEAAVTDRIRDHLWAKLWGNVSFSQIAVLTGATLGALAADEGAAKLARTIMAEAQAVGEALGASFPMTIDARIAQTARLGGHKTSVLIDLERGRPMEIDAMIGVVAELGRIAGVDTPAIDMTYALVRRRAIAAGCYPENPEFTLFG